MEEFETNLVEFSVSELSGAIKRQIEDSFGRGACAANWVVCRGLHRAMFTSM